MGISFFNRENPHIQFSSSRPHLPSPFKRTSGSASEGYCYLSPTQFTHCDWLIGRVNFCLKVKQSKLHTTVVASSEDGVVVGVFAGVVTGGRVPVASNLSVTGVGKVAAVNAGDRVGLGYGP